jgi:transcriptional regulator with XRE-family HTH domain
MFRGSPCCGTAAVLLRGKKCKAKSCRVSSPNLSPLSGPVEDPKLRLKRNLRAFRIKAGKTVVEAAEAVGKSRQAVTAWERFSPSEPVPDDRELELLAALYGTSSLSLRSSRVVRGDSELEETVASLLESAGFDVVRQPALRLAGHAVVPDLLARVPKTGTTIIIEVRSSEGAPGASNQIALLKEHAEREGYRFVVTDAKNARNRVDELIAFAHNDLRPSDILATSNVRLNIGGSATGTVTGPPSPPLIRSGVR